jgi:hypothetical protein
MATQFSALPVFNLSNQPTFTLTVGTISAFFATAGWVQTADTGQINYSTSTSGYQIWGLNDTLQATHPWYLKITYNGGGNPFFTFQLGTATDGAGNFTGTQISTVFSLSLNTGTGVFQRCYFSGANNRIAWNLWDGPTAYEALNFSVERTKDASGADTSAGLIVFGRANAGASPGQTASDCFSQVIPDAVTGLPQDSQPMWAAAVNLAQQTMAQGGKLGWAYPIPFNSIPFNNGLNFLLYQASDFPVYTVQTLNVYGTNHSYLVCTSNAASPTIPAALTHVLMLYE